MVHRRRQRYSGKTDRQPRNRAATRDARAATRLTLRNMNRPWVVEAGPKQWSNHRMILDVGARNQDLHDCRTGLDSTCNTACKTLGATIQQLSDVS